MYSPDEVSAIAEWALRHGIWVVTDEIYEHLTYGPHEFVSMPTLVPDIADQCIVLNGVAKTYAMTGWRVGWMIGPNDVIKASANFQSHATSNVCNVAQRAALAAVTGDLEAVRDDARGVRATWPHDAPHALGDPGGDLPRTPGRVLLLPVVRRACSAGDINGSKPTTTMELADVILTEAKVALVPGEAFGAPGFMRLSFALADDELADGIGRLQRLFA